MIEYDNNRLHEITHKSFINRINKEQQEANELRIRLECMRNLYINAKQSHVNRQERILHC